MRHLRNSLFTLALILFVVGIGLLFPSFNRSIRNTTQSEVIVTEVVQAVSSPTPRIIYVAQVQQQQNTDVEPINTLLPPPTLEPATPTVAPTQTATPTPAPSINIAVTVDGLRGLPTPTTQPENVCEPNADWQLRYEVQINDTLSSIANTFNTYANVLAEANCLDDPNLIRVGQELRVPGESLPQQPAIICEGYEVLTPINGAWNVGTAGQIVFNWRGTDAPRNLVRLYPPDFDFANPDPEKWFDYTVDLRQNVTVNLSDIAAGGIWHWQVIPLDMNFQQVCPKSPIWSFSKNEA